MNSDEAVEAIKKRLSQGPVEDWEELIEPMKIIFPVMLLDSHLDISGDYQELFVEIFGRPAIISRQSASDDFSNTDLMWNDDGVWDWINGIIFLKSHTQEVMIELAISGAHL